jgi:hypothetical protein
LRNLRMYRARRKRGAGKQTQNKHWGQVF